jgi:hypothetical protein
LAEIVQFYRAVPFNKLEVMLDGIFTWILALDCGRLCARCGCTRNYGRVHSFQRCVDTINNSLRVLFLEIRKGVSEDDGKQYYGLVW